MSLPRISFSLKLTFLNLLLFTACFGIALLVVLAIRYEMLRRQFDTRLLGEASRIGALLEAGGSLGAIPLAGAEVELHSLLLRDAGGLVVAATDDAPTAEEVPAPDADDDDGTVSGVTLGNRPCRVATVAFRDRDQQIRFLQVAAPAVFVDRLRIALADTLVIGLPISIAAVIISTALLTGRLVAPLKELSDAAHGLSPKALDRRIDVVEEGETSSEVARLQSELNEALTRMEEGFRAQEQFISNVAHDLKTPISVLLIEAQTIGSRAKTIDDYDTFRASVQEEMRRLGRLVESFLTLKRVEQGHALVRNERVSVNEFVLDSILHCTPVADHYEVKLIAQLHDDDGDELLTHGDPDLLQTMLDNIIGNAIRFSPLGSSIAIDVATEDGEAVVTVRDRGPGIPEDELAGLFDRFSRGSTQHDRGGGTGLGLAIAKSVAELHKGSIEARNHPDGGCAFSVRIPRAANC